MFSHPLNFAFLIRSRIRNSKIHQENVFLWCLGKERKLALKKKNKSLSVTVSRHVLKNWKKINGFCLLLNTYGIIPSSFSFISLMVDIKYDLFFRERLKNGNKKYISSTTDTIIQNKLYPPGLEILTWQKILRGWWSTNMVKRIS